MKFSHNFIYMTKIYANCLYINYKTIRISKKITLISLYICYKASSKELIPNLLAIPNKVKSLAWTLDTCWEMEKY